MIEFNNGIHLIGTDLWFDSKDPQDLCFVSHGHVDHLGSHSCIIASHPTARIFTHRIRETKSITLEYNKPYALDDMTIELFPAGHILGSSQIMVHYKNKRIVYTGDFKMKKSFTAEPIVIKKADILIMEATYGSPEYLFPDNDIVIAQLAESIDRSLRDGTVPVVLAYSLGKGQEAVKVLGERGYKLVLHKTIYELVKIYEEFGITFGSYEQYSNIEQCKNKILILPPYIRNSSFLKNIKNKRVMLLSGWALNSEKIKYAVDEMYPLSDHADFNELLEYVKNVNPSHVYVTHGAPEFVGHLKALGYSAEYLGSRR